MFNEIDNLEGILESLKLEVILFLNEDNHDGTFLNGDDWYIDAWEKMMSLADESIELEAYQSVLHKFSFPSMRRFYELCREYSKVKHISFKKNPYVREAFDSVKNAIYSSNAENFAWNLWIPKKIVKKKRDILLIETGCYFEEYLDMLELLYEIRDYYEEQSNRLYDELYGKSKIIKLPEVKKETRKAA